MFYFDNRSTQISVLYWNVDNEEAMAMAFDEPKTTFVRFIKYHKCFADYLMIQLAGFLFEMWLGNLDFLSSNWRI